VLRKPAHEVTQFNAALLGLIQKMDKIMRCQPHGIGIAAPQIGVSLRVAIVDVSSRVEGAQRRVLVNPQILTQGPECLSREGCMSLPDYTADLRRFEWIEAQWCDEKGTLQRETFRGIEAVCVQHEVDHLQGVLFLDRVACLKTDMYPRNRRRKRR